MKYEKNVPTEFKGWTDAFWNGNLDLQIFESITKKIGFSFFYCAGRVIESIRKISN